MEDNDLRGFLDGGFLYGWNQPGQIHVRIGRKQRNPRYGEHELFRVSLRWTDLPLPPSAGVERARLSLWVEKAPPQPVHVYLYEVQGDFDPGRGGETEDNLGAPRPGEIWWRERAHGEAEWGLPGLGLARDGDGDTTAEPLAEVLYEPGAETLVFESPRLAEAVQRRVAEGAPLNLLLKLSDDFEDLPIGRLMFHSGNFGDSRNPAWRPALEVDWRDPLERVVLERKLVLEHGRSLTLPTLTLPAGTRAHRVEFAADAGAPGVWVEVADSDGVWQRAEAGIRDGGGALRLRVGAVHDPVSLGSAFEVTLRDTWTPTGAPEQQQLRYSFRSPSDGRVETREAEYAGDHRWRLRFEPRELGRWTYSFEHGFTEPGLKSPPGHFDVVARDLGQVVTELERRAAALEAAGEPAGRGAPVAEFVQLSRLERAGVGLLGPDGLRGPEGAPFRAALSRLRAALQEPIPEAWIPRSRSDAASGRRTRLDSGQSGTLPENSGSS